MDRIPPEGPIRGNVTGSLYVFFVALLPTCLTSIGISRNLEAEILKKILKMAQHEQYCNFRVSWIKFPPMGPIGGNVT